MGIDPRALPCPSLKQASMTDADRAIAAQCIESNMRRTTDQGQTLRHVRKMPTPDIPRSRSRCLRTYANRGFGRNQLFLRRVGSRRVELPFGAGRAQIAVRT